MESRRGVRIGRGGCMTGGGSSLPAFPPISRSLSWEVRRQAAPLINDSTVSTPGGPCGRSTGLPVSFARGADTHPKPVQKGAVDGSYSRRTLCLNFVTKVTFEGLFLSSSPADASRGPPAGLPHWRSVSSTPGLEETPGLGSYPYIC